MTRFCVPGENHDTLSYADFRLPTVPAVQAPRRPTVNDKKYPLWCEWRTNKESVAPVDEGEFWKLVRFESNGDATWVRFFPGSGSGGIICVKTDSGAPGLVPDGDNCISIVGSTGVTVTGNSPGSTATVALDFSVVTSEYHGNTGTATPTAGVLNIVGDGTTISTAAAGNTVTISFAGGFSPVTKIGVDAFTGPGTNPVLPLSNQINILGAAVAAHSVPIETHSRAANAFNIEVQYASATASTTASSSGIAHFNSAAFSVDANGFVNLLGGGTAAISFTTDSGAPPVVPNGSGNVQILGGTGISVTGTGPGNTITITNTAAQYNPAARLQEFDDFLRPISNASKTSSSINTNSKLGFVSNACLFNDNTLTGVEPGHPGVWSLVVTSSGSYLTQADNSNCRPLELAGGILKMGWVVRMSNLSMGGDSFIIRIGMSDAATIPVSGFNKGLWFEYTHSVNAGQWTFISANAGVTTTNTTTAANTMWNKYEIEVNAAGNQVRFYINGVEVTGSPVATNIPTAIRLVPSVSIFKTEGSSTRYLHTDLYTIDYQLSTPR